MPGGYGGGELLLTIRLGRTHFEGDYVLEEFDDVTAAAELPCIAAEGALLCCWTASALEHLSLP